MELYPTLFLDTLKAEESTELVSAIQQILYDEKLSEGIEVVDYGDLLSGSMAYGFNNVKESSLVIFDVTNQKPYLMLALGLSIASGKPIVVIANSIKKKDYDIEFGPNTFGSRYGLVYYNAELIKSQEFRKQFLLRLDRYSFDFENAYYNFQEKYISKDELITIKISKSDSIKLSRSIYFIAEFLESIEDTNLQNSTILYKNFIIKNGSVKGIFNIDFKAISELIEKIVFFIPEWKKRKLENKKFELEMEILKKEIELKVKSQSIDDNLKNAELAMKLLEIFEKHKQLGETSIQFGKHLLIENKDNGKLTISKPDEEKINIFKFKLDQEEKRRTEDNSDDKLNF